MAMAIGRRSSRRSCFSLAALVASLSPAAAQSPAERVALLPPSARIAAVGGFALPETAKYDPELDVWFVTSMSGNPTTKDGDGSIAIIDAAEPVRARPFVRGGVDGAVLHGPKGIAIQGDTLWVADIDAIRGFHRRSGRAVRTIELATVGAVALNDIEVAPDGSLYVTDLRLIFDDKGGAEHRGADRLYRIAPDRSAHVAVEGDTLGYPNGLAWDRGAGRLLIGPLGSTAIFGWRPGEKAPTVVARGAGGWDGLEALGDGRWIASSVGKGEVAILEDGRLTTVLRGLSSPGNLGVDTRRNRVAIPLIDRDTVAFWTLHGAAAAPDSGRDVAEIREAIVRGARAFEEGDPETILSRYARDIILSYPGIPDSDYETLAKGYAELRKRPATVKATTVPTFDEILVSGDIAIVRVRWTTTIADAAAGRSATRRLKDLQVWRREPDGRWMFIRGMHYREPEPAGASSPPGR